MIRVRVDDFPHSLDREMHRHTLSSFRDFHRALTDTIGGKRYLLGVIPGRCTPDDLLFVRNETDCVVGMHGTDHDESRLDRNGGNQFESYLTVDNITMLLHENKTALQGAVGRPVTIYMPPRNVIDGRTWQACKRVGFERFTTGPETNAHMRAQNILSEIPSMPPHEYGRTDEMWVRNSQLDLALSERDVVLCIHQTWESNIGLGHMIKFLGSIPKDRFVDFDG